jgi:hypothetical protein
MLTERRGLICIELKVSAMSNKRAPNGVDSEKPIALRLMPEERELVQKIASQEDRSMASVCRRIVVSALKEHQLKQAA